MSLPPQKIADAATTVSAVSAGVSWLTFLQYAQVGFSILAAIVAIIAGLYAIRVHRRNLKK